MREMALLTEPEVGVTLSSIRSGLATSIAHMAHHARFGFLLGLAGLLAGCVSTPAPVVTPSPVATDSGSAAPLAVASTSPGEMRGSEPGWTSTIVQGSPMATASPSLAANEPSALASPTASVKRNDLPDSFQNKTDRLVKDSCTTPKGAMGDGWWVVMIGARAPESKNKEDWKYFGLLVDPVCFKAGPPPSISNPAGDLNWLRMSKDVRLTCAEGMTPCAIGVFRRQLPPYPPSKVPLGERNWPVAAIRINGGEIDRVEEIIMPGDEPRAVPSDTTQSGGVGAAGGGQPVAQLGGQPAGTLGAGG